MIIKDRWQTLTLAALIVLLLGCGGGYYELTLIPEGESLRRELVYTVAANSADTEPANEERLDSEEQPGAQPVPPEVKRLAEVYGTEVQSQEDGQYRFAATFTGAMPDDVGGAGRYSRKATSLGALCVYGERFRGSYELAATLERRFEKIETLTTLLASWVRTAGKESPLRDRLESVVAGELRRDLKDAVVLAMSLSAKQSEAEDEEFMMHLAHFFYERGYIDLDLILNGRWADESDAEMLSQFRRGLVLKLALDNEQPLLQTWPVLADPETANASLNEAVEATEVYQQYAREVSDDQDESETPEGVDLLSLLLWEISGFDLEPRDSLTVHLQCPHEPLLTNGEWLPDENRLRWQASMPMRDSPTAGAPPSFCYATWSEPDREFQQRRFGRVLIEGDALATYCSWRVSLHAREGTEWDHFLESLTPGGDLAGAISGFTFSGEADPSSPAARRIDEIQELLKKAL